MSVAADSVTLHASAVAWKDRGVLVTGASGAGKTSLAVEMLALGASLVADDWVVVTPGRAAGPVLSAPEPIRGLVELRGIGLVRLPSTDQAPLVCIVDLDREPVGRLPPRRTKTLLDFPCPVIDGRGRQGLAPALMAVLHAGGLLETDFFAGPG